MFLCHCGKSAHEIRKCNITSFTSPIPVSPEVFPGYAAFTMCLKAHFKMMDCGIVDGTPSTFRCFIPIVAGKQRFVAWPILHDIPRIFELWLSFFTRVGSLSNVVDWKAKVLNFIIGCFFAGGWPICSVRKSATNCLCDPSRNLWLHVYIFKLFHTSAVWASQLSVYIYVIFLHFQCFILFVGESLKLHL